MPLWKATVHYSADPLGSLPSAANDPVVHLRGKVDSRSPAFGVTLRERPPWGRPYGVSLASPVVSQEALL